ncbi:hypothetical protein GCM10007276_15980 [Agaricicola taiwanensis]|uniref:DUF1236 domain-containing protein n=1 Tax=Agaricicola taiwanensis TaxID=591372 RepID=A0A8J2VVL1_9RHOB|nr:DUF1236 domain-containing protein [Agaricicola taiwanensis]GGE39443.1 hypothetical protein GCM10007276_15980 [Agaricicola taiwanensis]
MKAILITATAASAIAVATFGAHAQTTITTTTTQPAPQVVFTPEQTTVIRRTFVEAPPPADPIVLDEDLIVGGIVPGSVPLQPVPSTIVTEVPNAQSYHYAVVGNEVVFVEPSTRRVVAVINQ